MGAKYIIKDSLNTFIKMVDTLEEVYKILNEFSDIFKDNYSILGGSLDGSEIYEDNAVFTIPKDMQAMYCGNKYITIYFFKFNTTTNELIKLY